MTTNTVEDARDQLAEDMKAVISDAEELLRATAGATGERIAAARARAEQTLRNAREKLSGFDDAVVDQAKQAARSADEYVRRNPWGAIGIAAVAGLLLGVVITSRR
jgi:ElaB/YqjD/DUF883 family membrane-anchored ribosome-binding protein